MALYIQHSLTSPRRRLISIPIVSLSEGMRKLEQDLVDGIVPARKNKSLKNLCECSLALEVPHFLTTHTKYYKVHIGQPSSASAGLSNTTVLEHRVTTIGE
jgi:hypothetical protein